MNNKGRETRAMWAIGFLFIAFFIGADAFANLDTADYYHDRALGFILGSLGMTFVLFAWNAVQYAVFLKRNKR